jgi:serine/threonine protein kinase
MLYNQKQSYGAFMLHNNKQGYESCVQYNAEAHSSCAEAIAARGATPKIADYGMVRRLTAGGSHVRPKGQGNPFYVAPEVKRQQQLCLASDIYSFGVIMWELMSGCLVYEASCAFPCLSFALQFGRPLHGCQCSSACFPRFD